MGRLGELSEKYLLEIEALLTVIEAAPVFDAVMLMVLLVPVVTLPKSRLAPLKAKTPRGCWVEDLLELNPWQPIRMARLRKTSARLQVRRSSAAGGGRQRLFIRFGDEHIESLPPTEIRPDFEGTY